MKLGPLRFYIVWQDDSLAAFVQPRFLTRRFHNKFYAHIIVNFKAQFNVLYQLKSNKMLQNYVFPGSHPSKY